MRNRGEYNDGMTESGEKRRHPRIPLQARAIVYASERQLECVACSLSEGGALILPPAKARAGLPMRINIGIAGLPEWIVANAVLVREGEYQGRYAWGVRFTQITPHAATLLRSYVRRTLRGDPEPQMSANAQPLIAVDTGSGSGSQPRVATGSGSGSQPRVATGSQPRVARAGPTPAHDARRYDVTGPHAPVATGSLNRRSTRERVASGGYARVGGAPPPEPAPGANPGHSGDDYTDPFADLPTAGSKLKDVAETSAEFAEPDTPASGDWEDAHSNVDLNKLYKDALDDVTPKKEPKKKGWFS